MPFFEERNFAKKPPRAFVGDSLVEVDGADANTSAVLGRAGAGNGGIGGGGDPRGDGEAVASLFCKRTVS